MVGHALEQDADGHAAPGSGLEGVAKAEAGQKIGAGDEDFATGGGDGFEIGVGDVVAVPDVVPPEEGCLLAAHRPAVGRREAADVEAALEVGPDDDFPHPPDRFVDFRRAPDPRRAPHSRSGGAGRAARCRRR